MTVLFFAVEQMPISIAMNSRVVSFFVRRRQFLLVCIGKPQMRSKIAAARLVLKFGLVSFVMSFLVCGLVDLSLLEKRFSAAEWRG